MPAQTHRSVLRTVTLVESRGTPEEHQRTVQWVANQMKDSARFVKGGFVATNVTDTTAERGYGFSGHGAAPSEETDEIVTDLFNL